MIPVDAFGETRKTKWLLACMHDLHEDFFQLERNAELKVLSKGQRCYCSHLVSELVYSVQHSFVFGFGLCST